MRHDKDAIKHLPVEIDFQYFALYRRILKMILERGCSVKMASGEAWDVKYKERFETIFDDLIFLGDSIISCAENKAEQEMIGDAIGIAFDKSGLFYLYRKHYFEDAFRHIVNMNLCDHRSFVVDQAGEEDFICTAKNAFKLIFLR
jgi:hypothetical protein